MNAEAGPVTQRPHRRRKLWIESVLIFLLLAFVLVGHHRHKLEIHIRDRVVRFVSSHSPFQVSLPDRPAARSFTLGYTNEEEHSRHIIPRSVTGWGWIISTQVVTLPETVTNYVFLVNTIRFELADGKLTGANETWKLAPGETLEIDVDDLD